MTYKEIADKYIDLFVLIIETAGDVTNNQSYKNIENTVKKNRKELDRAIEDEVDFGMFIVILITTALLDIHSLEDLSDKNEDEMYTLISDMWDRYLKKPTRKFLAQNGMKLIDELNYSSIIFKRNEKF
jgi:hypothetical protein